MIKVHRAFSIFLITTLISCWGRHATEWEKKKAFSDSHFDSKIIQNLDKYTALRAFLIYHLDTIINYRNSKNLVSNVGENSHVGPPQQKDEDCWLFTTASGPYDIANVPPFIYPTLDSLIKNLGPGMFDNFTICKDSALQFNIGYIMNFNVNDLEVLHSLKRNKPNVEVHKGKYSKDTLIGIWDYNICVFHARGW